MRASAVIAAAVLTRKLEAVLWAAIAVWSFRAVLLVIYIRWRQQPASRKANLADLGRQLRFSLPFAIAVLFEIGAARFHEYYVAASVTPAQFAIYAVGILQIPVIGMLVQSVVEVLLVRASEAHKVGDRAQLRRLWKAAVERLAVILIPCWALAELLADDLVILLFGAPYAPSIPILRIFLTMILLMVIIDHGILRATGDTVFLFATNVVGFVASVLAILLLTRYSVLLGGVAAYIVGLATMRGMGLYKVSRRLQLWGWEILPWRTFGRVVVAVAVSSLIAATALALPARVPRLGLASLLFSLTYGAIAFAWELVPRSEILSILRRLMPAYHFRS